MFLHLLLLCQLAQGPCAAAPDAQDVTTLRAGSPVEREITAGDTQRYELTAAAGEFVRVIIEQRGIDVGVELLGPDNRLIADVDDEIGGEGREEITLVADTTGVYVLTVSARRRPGPTGSYEIRLADTRAATGDDRRLQEARRLRTEAERLVGAFKADEALPLAERALAIAERVPGISDTQLARFVVALGHAYESKNDSPKALELFNRALHLFERALGSDHLHTAYAAGRVGSLYVAMGELAKADQLIRRALEIQEKALGPNDPLVAMSLRSLGHLLVTRGDLGKAEEIELRALTIVEKTPGADHRLASDLLNNLGVIYISKQEYERAGPFLQRALAIMERLVGPDHSFLANVLQNLGIVAREARDYARAEQYYLRALSLREKSVGPGHPDIAANLINIANLHRAKGDYPRSLEMHLRALEILEKTVGPFHNATVLSLGNIARTYAAMGDLPNAIAFQSRVDAALETGIALRLAIGSEREKLASITRVSERTDRTISLNMQLAPADPEASALAVLVLLQRKGRVLDAMTDTLAALRMRADADSQALLDQLNDVVAQLARLVLSGPQKTSPDDHRQAIGALEEKKEQLEAGISRRSAEFRARSVPVTLEAVQAAIPNGAALVEFATYRPFDPRAESNTEAYGKTRYVAYVVRRQGTARGTDLGEAEGIDRAVDALRQALRDPARRDVRGLSRALDAMVMRPVRALVGDAAQLLLSPDGALNLIPFEALIDEQGRYLVQRYAATYLTSGRDLLRLQGPRDSESGPLILADPLFGELAVAQTAGTAAGVTRRASARGRRSVTGGRDLSDVYFAPIGGTAREARSIRALFPDADVLIGARATETSLKRAASPRLLHIATHGFFLHDAGVQSDRAPANPVRPGSTSDPLLRSGLAFADANVRSGSGSDDGILTALEASGLNLWGTRLVALSACDTGLGEVKNGEGVYGLRRAFVLAGAESLLMSLWPVSDSWTQRLMTSYYTNLKQGMGRGESLRHVQLDMLTRNAQLHPFYWANFIQSGEWAGLDGKR